MNTAAKMKPTYISTPYAATPSAPISFISCKLYSALTSEADRFVISSLEPLAQALPSALALKLGRTKCKRLVFLRLAK